jgi:hypothetical protein
MNKYVIFIILTTPLILYLMFNVVLLYKLKKLRPTQAAIRFVLWGLLLIGIWFTRPITDFLYQNELTASPPLSIFEIFLTTGLLICFIMIGRAHSRLRELEDRFTKLHEKASIAFSETKK